MTQTIDRRALLAGSALLAGCTVTAPQLATFGSTGPTGFVRRDGMRLMVGAEPYRFVGANVWYAAWLGANAPYGDRARLRRELDTLQAMGITNLRIMASGEEGPLRNSITPGFRDAGTDYSQALLGGLDFALAAHGRDAIDYLTVHIWPNNWT